MALSVETVELDVTNNASVDTAFKVVSAKTGGKLDVLVNNAGLASAGIGETFTPEQLRDMFEVNVLRTNRTRSGCANRKSGLFTLKNIHMICLTIRAGKMWK